jgi:RNA polymerase sigma-70 factor (sigma-E family)
MMLVVGTPDALPLPVSERHEAIAALFQEQYRHLLRVAALLVDERDVAEELVQEAFLRLQRSWPLRDPDGAPAYLRSTVLNLARSRLRRRLVVLKHPSRSVGDAPGADEGALLRDDQAAVIDALRTLPQRQRECVVLRYYAGLSEAEIASTLAISAGSVKSHTSRAMAALATRLEDRR